MAAEIPGVCEVVMRAWMLAGAGQSGIHRLRLASTARILAHSRDQGRHVGRTFGFDAHGFAARRVDELEFLGMQCLAAKTAQGLDQWRGRCLRQAQVAVARSPTIGCRVHYAMCTRIWCVRPVSRRHSTRVMARNFLAHAVVGDGFAAILAHGLAQPSTGCRPIGWSTLPPATMVP